MIAFILATVAKVLGLLMEGQKLITQVYLSNDWKYENMVCNLWKVVT